MTPQQAADLEAAVAKKPDDMEARRKLLIHYQYNARRLPDRDKTRIAFRTHWLWYIEHHPENEMARLINPLIDREGDQRARQVWLANSAKPDAPPQVLASAASFLAAYDLPLAEQLLARAQAANPDSDASRSIGGVYARLLTPSQRTQADLDRIRKSSAESSNPKVLFAAGGELAMRFARAYNQSDADMEAFAVSCLTRAAQLDPALAEKVDSLKGAARFRSRKPAAPGSPLDLAHKATRAYQEAASDNSYRHDQAKAKGGWEDARKYARQALDAAARLRNDPDYGTAVHTANMVLGMVAMRVDGNKKAAAKYLLEAAKAPATDELTYSPDYFTLKLPVLLLKYGGLDERDAVIQFLDSYGKIVRRSDYTLLADAEKLRKGYMPVWYQYQAAQLK
jgi:hypothetical protein